MALIDSGLGWWVEEEYYTETQGILLATVVGREFYKSNAGPMIVAMAHAGGYSGPITLSTVESYSVYTPYYSHLSATVDDVVWHIGVGGWFGGTPSSTGGITEGQAPFELGSYDASDIARLLEYVGMTTKPPGPSAGGFSIDLQYNASDRNVLDKNVSIIQTITGRLREPTSIIDPVIIIQADLAELINCNYLTIDIFGRSYFVNNVRSIRNGLIELTCHVDVLSSFKTQIRANKAIVSKQENDWNLYLNDGSIQVYAGKNIYTKPFPNGFSTFQFVLAVAG